jgi:hypothetical protein
MNLVKFEGGLPAVTLEADVVVQRDTALAEAWQIQSITCPADERVATIAGVSLKKILNAAEASRKDVKAPVLDVGKRIDGLAAEYVAPITAALARLGALLARWQEAERQRVAAEERARQAEIQRLEAERLAAEAEARRLQEAALESEAAGFAPATTEAVLEAAVQADTAALTARAQSDIAISAPLPAPQRTAGSVARMETIVEVFDVHALYAARPELVKLEPKVGALKSIWTPGMEIPGCKIYQQPVASFRSR